VTECSECKKEIIDGTYIGTSGNVFAHQKCYYLANPPKIRETFNEVLANCDDQFLVRSLLNQ
jgi:hypothetical protein